MPSWPYPRRHEIRARASQVQDSAPPPALYREDGLALSMLDQAGGLDEVEVGHRLSQRVTDYLYESTWMAVIVDIFPDLGTEPGFDLVGLPGDVAEGVQSIAEDLNLAGALNMGWKWARKDGGGAIVKVLDDKRPSDQPVDYANLDRVVALVAMDRHELLITEWGNTGTGIGPLMYQDMQGQAWHHSRVVPIYNRELALRRRPYYQYWSLGEFDRVYLDFLRDRDVQQALAKLLKEYSFDVIQINELRSKGKDEIRKMLIGLGLGIQKLGKIAIDKQDGYTSQSKNMAGLPDSVKLITSRLSMITRIPASILSFENPGGLNSGANQGDWESLYGQVSADRKKHYTPVVANIVADILAARTGPAAGIYLDRWHVEPRPLGQLSPEREAAVEGTKATRRASDVQAGIITVEEARRDQAVVTLYSIEPEEVVETAAPLDGDPLAPPDQPLSDVALNGAQVQQLVGVLTQPLSARQKRAVIQAAFPTIASAQIEEMVAEDTATASGAGALAGAAPTVDGETAEPAPTPGRPPPGENLVNAAQVKERYGVGLDALKSMVKRLEIRGWKYPGGWKFLESEVATAGLHQPESGQEPEEETP